MCSHPGSRPNSRCLLSAVIQQQRICCAQDRGGAGGRASANVATVPCVLRCVHRLVAGPHHGEGFPLWREARGGRSHCRDADPLGLDGRG